MTAVSSFAIIPVSIDGTLHVIVEKSMKHGGGDASWFHLPGGKAEDSDPSARAVLVRELREELGAHEWVMKLIDPALNHLSRASTFTRMANYGEEIWTEFFTVFPSPVAATWQDVLDLEHSGFTAISMDQFLNGTRLGFRTAVLDHAADVIRWTEGPLSRIYGEDSPYGQSTSLFNLH